MSAEVRQKQRETRKVVKICATSERVRKTRRRQNGPQRKRGKTVVHKTGRKKLVNKKIIKITLCNEVGLCFCKNCRMFLLLSANTAVRP